MAKRNNWTPKQSQEILSKPFEIWPACRCSYCEQRDFKRGPTPDQKRVYKIPHKHTYDIVLAYGGRRGAKSQAAIAKGIWYALNHPGCTILVGAKTLELLKRTALKYWKERFTIKTAWDHPLVKRAPGDHNKCLELINGTQIWFLHFEDFEVLRGIGITFAHIEEGSLLTGEDSMQEIARSLSETLAIQNQLIITTNPEESKGWIHETFSLKQFEPGYKGEPMPIGQNCTCQFCPKCIAEYINENSDETYQVPWVEGKDLKGRPALVCPRCPEILVEDDNGKMIPRMTVKDNDCPGNQSYTRVVFFDPVRNPHTPSAYREMSRQTTSKEKFALYTKGDVVELDQSKVYEAYNESLNVLETDRPLDFNKEMVWSFDFNNARQCSVICQEREIDGGTAVDIIDEIVIPPVPNDPSKTKVSPYYIGKAFLFRYPTYNMPITVHSDPAAMNDRIGDNDIPLFQMVVDVITEPEKHLTEEEYAEFLSLGGVPKKVKSIPVKVKGQTKIMVKAKVNATNAKLVDSSGKPWIFINPKCKWLTYSLDNLKWSDTTKTAIDVKCDKADRKNPNKQTVRLVSHITDALGYYIAKKWPVSGKEQEAYAIVPGQVSVEMINGEIVETHLNERDLNKEEQLMIERAIAKSKLAAIQANKGSLLEFLHETDFFEGNSGGIFDYFEY